MNIKKGKNRRAPAQPWPEGIISAADGFFLEHQRNIRMETNCYISGFLIPPKYFVILDKAGGGRLSANLTTAEGMARFFRGGASGYRLC